MRVLPLDYLVFWFIFMKQSMQQSDFEFPNGYGAFDFFLFFFFFKDHLTQLWGVGCPPKRLFFSHTVLFFIIPL